MKVGGDVGFLHMRTQQNPKKIEWYRKMCTTCAPNKSDHWLRLLVGSSSLSPLARPYSFFFPTLPPWEKSLWCWSGMTQQLRSRTSEKLGFLNMLGASESTEVISFCILGYVCDGSCTGSAHGYRGMIAAVWYGNDAVLCFYVDMTMHLDLTLSGWNLKFEKQSHTLLEYVIGGGTGELPPQRYEVSVLGLWLVDGLQVTCLVYVICYLVGVSFCTYSTSSLALCCISSQIISAGLWEWHCSYRSSAVWWLVAYRLNEMARERRMIERELMRSKKLSLLHTYFS